MTRYDLHMHTNASPCSRAQPEAIVNAAVGAGMDGIAITDHDTLENYPAVRDAAPPELQVIPGVEVTTTQGHVLALGIDEVPPRSNPVRVIESIHDQDGLAILAHPFDRLRESYTIGVDQILRLADGIETINSRCLRAEYNLKADRIARKYDLAVTGGSDAHFPHEVGRAYTVAQNSLFDAIRGKQTSSQGRGQYISGHMMTKINDVANMLR